MFKLILFLPMSDKNLPKYRCRVSLQTNHINLYMHRTFIMSRR